MARAAPAGALIAALAIGIVGTLVAGSLLAAPSPAVIGPPPGDLRAENVEIPSASGCLLKGWLVPGVKGRGAVVLMHGIHANRLAMVPRARFLARAGYTVILFDFQAHGESIDAVAEPVLLIAGGRDVDTTPAESRRLFQAVHDPKEYWEIPGAGHQDFHAFAGREYETRIVSFFDRYLTAPRTSQPRGIR